MWRKENSDLSHAEAQRDRAAEGWGDFLTVVRGLGEEPESKKGQKDHGVRG
jgi:hypothetical protein